MEVEVIKMLNFQKSYDGKEVHRDVSFYLHKGKCLGLLGGSGAGKSVILRSLIGLEKPDGGSLQIFGDEVSGRNEEDWVELRKKVSYVFQDGALFDSMTVFENVAYPLVEHTQLSGEEIKTLVTEVLAEFDLDGTEELMKSELSGGMQKRVGLARSIILKPEILLYDEPTAGLDPANTINIQNIILQLKKRGNSSILVTHDMPTALAVCDDICLLHEGRILARCSASELKTNQNHPINQFMQGEREAFNDNSSR